MPSPSSTSSISNDVSNLKQDMAKVGLLVERLDVAISKLTEVSSSVSQLLAVHESKLIAQEALLNSTTTTIERRREEMEDKVQLVHGRVSSGEKQLTERMDDQHDQIMDELKEMRKDATDQHSKMSTRISLLEKLVWIAVGASGILGAILSKINFSAII